jgi:hypothetical protein
MNPKQPPGPAMTLGNMRELGVLLAFTAAVLGGCSSVSPENTLYAQPGKYDFLDCPSIAERSKKASERVEKLRFLMSRASEDGPQGAIVNAIAYQDEMNAASADLYMLRKASDAKHCPAS